MTDNKKHYMWRYNMQGEQGICGIACVKDPGTELEDKDWIFNKLRRDQGFLEIVKFGWAPAGPMPDIGCLEIFKIDVDEDVIPIAVIMD